MDITKVQLSKKWKCHISFCVKLF